MRSDSTRRVLLMAATHAAEAHRLTRMSLQLLRFHPGSRKLEHAAADLHGAILPLQDVRQTLELEGLL
jgi:hypothetical protein